ncbi:predicted protein [Postia placenta Mad-698-R]|nr:predicted protein [Postia placenta Mad-698-R]
MAPRHSNRSSLVEVDVSTINEDAVAAEGPTSTSPDEQRSQSDTPYRAGDAKVSPEELPAASSECKAAQGDAKNGQAASGKSRRKAAVGSTPAQQGKQEVKSTTGTGVSKGEDEQIDDPWSLCANEVWKFEERQVNKWKENINNLLLFAGLFSTILAAFLAAFYMLLGPQTPDATTQVLAVMSAQLSLLTAAIAHHNLTDSQQATLDAAIATTHPTTITVSTSVLWFIALIFSLGAASISIAVDRASSLSRQSVRIWSLRRRGLHKWHVQAIIDVLPILLQISLALFLVGLLNLVWHLDYIVASTSTVIIAALLLPTLLTVFVPYFYADCPYKSRSAWWCFVALNRFTHSRCAALLVKCWEALGISIANVISANTKIMLSLRRFPAATGSMLSGRREIFTLNQSVWRLPAAIITHIAKGSKFMAKSLWDHTCKLPFATICSFLVLIEIVAHRLTNIRRRLSRSRRRLSKFCQKCANWMRWRPRISAAWSKWHSDTLGARNWREFENLLVRTDNTPEEEKLMMLAEADEMIMDDAFLVNVVHPCLQNSSLRSALPALLRILRHRAHKVTFKHEFWRRDMTVIEWLTSEQDSAAIIAMADLCIDVIQKYKNPDDRDKDDLVDHLLQLIRAMPLIDPARTVCNRARDLIQWAATNQRRLREARIDELDNGADECFLEYVVPAWLCDVDKDDSLEPFYNMLRNRVEADRIVSNQMTLALGHRALDVLDKALLESREDALDKLVDIIYWLVGTSQLDIEDIRKLLKFLPHAREQLGTERFLRITSSALKHSAQLPLDDFDRVYSDVRGALNVVVEYFSSSGIEEVAQAHAWWKFGSLLCVCVELARADNARPTRKGTLLSRDVINALESCVSQCPQDKMDYIESTMEALYSALGYYAGSVPNEPVAGETVSPALAPRDVDKAPTEDPQVVDGTPMR